MDQALRSLPEGDRMFTGLLAEGARRRGLPATEITTAMSGDHLAGAGDRDTRALTLARLSCSPLPGGS